jgi:hypothetical protein
VTPTGAALTIAQAVAAEASQLPVNTAILCSDPGGPATHLDQIYDPSFNSADVAIAADIVNIPPNPSTIKITLTYTLHGLAPPLNGAYSIGATSQLSLLSP